MRVHVYPKFSGEDNGDGGIRRVVEAQMAGFKKLRIEHVDEAADADIIAAHIAFPPQYQKLFPEKPFVAHCHGLYWSEFEWEPWSYNANRDVLRSVMLADATTAPTEWVAQIIRRHTSRDVRVIPHGVSTKEWQPLPIEERSGYVLWNKTRVDAICTPADFDMLARAMPEEKFVSTFGTALPNTQIVGKLSYEDGKEAVMRAGVYLATSRETFGIGTLEAMACGVPVVGYNFGGQAEFVRHGVDGYLAAPGDVEDLIRGVRWAYDNLATAGIAARETAKKFTWEKAMLMYRDLYQELIERYAAQHDAPRVSIIVPAFNLEKYLPDTLNSIKAQTDGSWECIIVDDASPDSCGDIADAYADQDERFSVIHNESNLYLAESRNVAIERARGRYIMAVDADDKIPPKAVETLANALDADRHLDVVYGSVLFTEEDGVTPTNYGVAGRSPGHSNWPFAFEPDKQIEGFNLLPYSSMFRRSAWKQVGGYRRRLVTAEDADLWTRFTSYGFQIEKVTDADMLVYRNREGSMSRVKDAHRHDYIRWYPWVKDVSLAPAGYSGPKTVSLLTPRVSVVIPVGPGHEKLVQDAVDSVASQSFRLWECIVVNDSGTDLHLPTWVREIKCDARDAGAARNVGIAASLSTLFLPLDADDVLQPDALQWFVSAYVENGANRRIVYSDFWEDPRGDGVFTVFHCPEFSCETIRKQGGIYTVTALTPKSVWREVGGYGEGLAWEDMDFQFRCAAAGVCTTHIAAPLFTYRKFTGLRRNWSNEEELKVRKLQMTETWGEYLAIGGKDFMACGCAQSQVAQPQMTTEMRSSERQYGDAVLIEYVGNREGDATYRGPTGNTYQFSKTTKQGWVAGADAAWFAARKDFAIMSNGTQSPVAGVDSGAPVLTV